MEYQEFDRVKLKNGQVGTVVDAMGGVYAVDIGCEIGKFRTEIVEENEIEGLFLEEDT